jgi:hypothetical protein
MISGRNLLLVLHLDILRRRPNLRLLLILQNTVTMDEGKYTQTNTPAHDDRDFRRHISRRITWSERLGSYVKSEINSKSTFKRLTNDIPNTIPNQIHRRNRRLLRVPSHVTRDQTQQRNKRRRTRLRQIITR